jgi:sodium pump decarboxylase gamma subunit
MESHISSYFTGTTGGLTMSFIAFSIVFIVIVGLMLLMMGLKHVCAAIDSVGKKKPAAPGAQAPAPAPAKPAAAVSKEDDGELLAVISAAIAAACGSAARVVSFRPIHAPEATSWKLLGRMQNSEGFQD